MARILSIHFFLFFLIVARATAEQSKGFLTALEETLENKISDYVGSFAEWLESFNDKYLGQSELGRLLHYREIKTKLEETGRRRSMKMGKLGMGMLPLVFHVGATSTWMVLTTLLAAKSVAIGLALLVFKIAVSSAKVASFFTSLKSKIEHHGWSHGHDRSLSGAVPHIDSADISYAPGWSPGAQDHQDYRTIPTYQEYSEHDHSGPFQGITYVGDSHTEPHS